MILLFRAGGATIPIGQLLIQLSNLVQTGRPDRARPTMGDLMAHTNRRSADSIYTDVLAEVSER